MPPLFNLNRHKKGGFLFLLIGSIFALMPPQASPPFSPRKLNSQVSFSNLATWTQNNALSAETIMVDFNRDGFDDMILTQPQGGFVIFRNLKDGTFSQVTLDPMTFPSTLIKNGQAYDVDMDGLQDLMFLYRPMTAPSNDRQQMYWSKNLGNFSFGTPQKFLSSFSVTTSDTMQPADVLDFIVGDFLDNGLPIVYYFYQRQSTPQVNFIAERIGRRLDGTSFATSINNAGIFTSRPKHLFARDFLGGGRRVPIFQYNASSSSQYTLNGVTSSSNPAISFVNESVVALYPLLNNPDQGGGNFSNGYQYLKGTSYATADFNQDGNLDFFVLGRKPNNPITPTSYVTTLTSHQAQKSTGTFSYLNQTITTSVSQDTNAVFSLTTEDMNADGFADLLIAESIPTGLPQSFFNMFTMQTITYYTYTHTIKAWLNNQDGTFSLDPTTLATGNGAITNIQRDNFLKNRNLNFNYTVSQEDVNMVTNQYSNTISVKAMNYTPSIATVTLDEQGGSEVTDYFFGTRFTRDTSLTTTGSQGVAIGDFNFDGTTDIIVPEGNVNDVTVTDLFKEGVIGYLTLDGTSGELIYARSKRDGTFYRYPITEDVTNYTMMQVSDLDRDGHRDILLANPTLGQVVRYGVVDSTNAPFTITQSTTSANQPIVVNFSSGTLTLNGQNLTSGGSIPVTQEGVNTFIHTLDGVETRGHVFVVTMMLQTGMNPITFEPITTNSLVASRPRYTRKSTPLVTGYAGMKTFAVADINVDARPDFIIGNDQGQISYYQASGAEGSFITTTIQTTLPVIDKLEITDINQDARLDFLLVSQTSGETAILYQDPDAGTYPTTTYINQTFDQPRLIATTDLSGDNYADLIVFTEDGIFGMLYDPGTETFGLAILLDEGGVTISKMVVVDYNLDNAMDMMLFSPSTNQVFRASGVRNALYINQEPSKDGFLFDDWYIEENITTTYDFNQQVAEDITLYAGYALATITVTYQSEGVVDNDNQTSFDPNGATVTLNDPERLGYTFLGWYDNDLFGGDEVSELNSTNTEDITLYAAWDIEIYSITYVLNGGSNDASNLASYTVEDAVTLNEATPGTGQTFLGWYDNESFTGDPITTINIGSTGPVTLYAKFSNDGFAITYEVGDGENDPTNPLSYDTSTATITLNDPVPADGFTFVGWYDNPLFVGDAITNIPLGSIGNLTLYALYETIQYNITYELNGGTNAPENPTSYTTDHENILLLEPTRLYYEFGGWYDNALFFGDPVTTISENSLGEKDFYAKWNASIYTITYELNGGTNSRFNPLSFTVEISPFVLDEAALHGYHFVGWYSAPEFDPSDEIISIDQTLAGEMLILYANFDPIQYQVFYELGGGINSILNPINYSIEDAIMLENPTRAGHTFDGWYAQPSFVGAPVTEITIGSTGVLAFYAKWIADDINLSYEVFYVIDQTITTELVLENQSPIAVPTPSKIGFTFDGWVNSLGNSVEPSMTTITTPTVFIATFTPEEITTTYQITYVVETTVSFEIVTEGYSPTEYPLNPTKAGYSFEGWYLTGMLVVDISSYPILSDTIFVASFTRDITTPLVTIFFYVDGTLTHEEIEINTTLMNIPLEPVKPGFTFMNWTIDGVGVDLANVIFTQDTVVVATFSDDNVTTPTTYLVQFVVHTTVIYTENVTEFDIIQNIPENPTQLNATFLGWFINETLIDISTYGITNDTVIVAQFEMDNNPNPETTYSVFYIVGDVTTSETVIAGAFPSEVPANPTQPGSSFVGWSLDGVITPPTTIAVTESIIFFAVFELDPIDPETTLYLVQFLVDSTVVASESVVADNVAPTPTPPSKIGYTFLGWYVNGSIIDVLTYSIQSATVFVAQFELDSITPTPLMFDVIYVIDGQVIVENVEENNTPSNVPTNPSKVGFTFLGWLFDSVITVPSEKPITETTIFIAAFEANVIDPNPTTYQVTYVVGSTVTTEIVEEGATVASTPSNPTLAGFSFVSWRIDGVQVNLSTFIVESNVVVVAHFEVEENNEVTIFNVFYVVGTTITTEQVELNETPSQTPSNPSQIGYTFDGWLLNGVLTNPSTMSVTEDLVFIAKFSVDEVNPNPTMYQVSFIANASVVKTESVVAEGFVSQVPNEPSKVGYTFLGWYVDGEEVSDILTYAITETTIFIAVFEANVIELETPTFTVSFVVEEAVVLSIRVEEDTSISNIPNTPTLQGHTFSGWLYDGQVVDLSTLIITEDTILIASFSPIPMTTYLVLYVIEGSLIFEEVTAGGTLKSIPENPEKTGHTFVGWMWQDNLIDTTTFIINEDTVLVATFQPIVEVDETVELVIGNDGHYMFDFNDATATLNGEIYEAGTAITTPGQYELIITFINGRLMTYVFTIAAPQSTVQNDMAWLWWASVVANAVLVGLLLLSKNQKQFVSFVLDKDSRQVKIKQDQKGIESPYRSEEIPAQFLGWFFGNQRVDLLTWIVVPNAILVAEVSSDSPGTNTEKMNIIEPLVVQDDEDKDFDLNDDASLTFSFSSLGIDTFYQRLTDPCKVEFASMFMQAGSLVKLGTILYRDGYDNTNFFGQVLKSLRPHRWQISLPLMQAIHDEMLSLTKANPSEQTRVNNAMLVYYYFRRKDGAFLEETIVRAYRDIQLHREVLKSENSFVFSYKRLAIALEKSKRYQEAIQIVEEAIAKGLTDKTVGEYPKRLARLQSRLKSSEA